jgi:hypothetical protein
MRETKLVLYLKSARFSNFILPNGLFYFSGQNWQSGLVAKDGFTVVKCKNEIHGFNDSIIEVSIVAQVAC